MPFFRKNAFLIIFGACFFVFASNLFAQKPAEISYRDVTAKMKEIMQSHVSAKKMNEEIAKRSLDLFIDSLDPTKTYFLRDDVEKWIEPEDGLLHQIAKDFEKAKFSQFQAIFDQMKEAIIRRNILEQKIDNELLPQGVSAKEFKNMTWCKTNEDLVERLKRLRALQLDVASKMGKEAQDTALSRLKKRRLKVEEDYMNRDRVFNERMLCTLILKSISSSLDAHTTYFTPSEASQFLISVQQKLLGIGVQLRDDIDGFTIVKIVEGGPADKGKELKVKDKVIAINNEPVIGLDVGEVVELIRGQEGTQVVLRVIRELGDNSQKSQMLKDIPITRGEVVLQESRIESTIHPFADGVIAHIRLHAFYQDNDSSSSADLAKALAEIQKNHKISGIILDLRYNAGGMLSQAVSVAGLFLQKGVIVSIKDETGQIHPLRDLDTQMCWNGPLIVLINRASASAAEIVTGALQDYGRAIIVGDDHTYGKGTFQTFTLTSDSASGIDPRGEYKVTRGCYYTASGKSPQLVGVKSDVVVPSGLETLEVGEMFAKYPLENDAIESAFDDNLADVPLLQRDKLARLYLTDHQEIEKRYTSLLPILAGNSKWRQSDDKAYKQFLEAVKNDESELFDTERGENRADFQLYEALNVVKDLIILSQEEVRSAA